MDERKVEMMCEEESMFTMQKLLELNKETVTDGDLSEDDLATVCMIWKAIKEIKTVQAMGEGANWLKGR